MATTPRWKPCLGVAKSELRQGGPKNKYLVQGHVRSHTVSHHPDWLVTDEVPSLRSVSVTLFSLVELVPS